MTLSREIDALIQQIGRAPVVPTPSTLKSGCFYCGSQTHAMAVPERVVDWNPGPLCYPSPGCR